MAEAISDAQIEGGGRSFLGNGSLLLFSVHNAGQAVAQSGHNVAGRGERIAAWVTLQTRERNAVMHLGSWQR